LVIELISSTSGSILRGSWILTFVLLWFHSLVDKLVDLLWHSIIVELLLELLVWILVTLVVTEVLRLGLVLLKSLHQLLLMHICLTVWKLLHSWDLLLLRSYLVEILAIYLLNLVWLLELLLHALWLLVELLHACSWVDWLKTLKLGVIVHSWLSKLSILDLLLTWLIQLVEAWLTSDSLSWVLTTVLRFLLLLELHHLLLSLLWLEGIGVWLHWLEALSELIGRNV
jgi:hypothetical protein